jgi:two-component system probable response regulator PhcQ
MTVEKCAVLLVDDEERMLKYFKRRFEKEFPVFCASNAIEAKNILNDRSHEIAVLITDQRMPGESGTELLTYVKNRYPTIVRILTTAFSSIEDAVEAVNNGEIYRYITKPWDFDELNKHLHNGLELYRFNRERNRLLQEKLSVGEF